MPLPIIIAFVFIICFVIYVAVKNKRKEISSSDDVIRGKKGDERKGLGVSWLLYMVILVGLGSWWLKDPQITRFTESKEGMYEWYWKLPKGVHVRGRNESAVNERVAEVTPRSDGSLWVNVQYKEHGSPEMARIRLQKVGAKSWEGTWEQDNPADHGRIALEEVALGVYAGDITWQNGLRGRCHLMKK